jgi:AraC-like DNA-binding protein
MAVEGVDFVIGVRFRPGGFYPFARKSVARWTGRSVPLRDVVGDIGQMDRAWAQSFREEVRECRGDREVCANLMAARLNRALRQLRVEPDETAVRIAAAVESLSAKSRARRVADLEQQTGYSQRTLYRLFDRYVGASPGWVIRRYRLHAVVERLTTTSPANLPGLAEELGYSDQAHLIRDFRDMFGVTPGQYVRR